MNEFPFQVKVAEATGTAQLRFASRNELQHYHRSLAPFAKQQVTIVREAVEFTRLAAKRWRYYSRTDEAVDSFDALRRAVGRNASSEIAFIMIATMRQEQQDLQVGLAYCRRTWCHHLALDFLALHPSVLTADQPVAGLGSGMVYGLVQLAKVLKVSRIWGEATVNSARFYEKLLAVSPIQDLFIIEAAEMAAIALRQQKISATALASKGKTELQ